ncbi:uncharacterized protein LOC105398770 isoform X1 [Plutella xylostella]|uniref:uncharacterized protein LOC105398770 isoform X1 n=1 Tax=Plutella xylostella TaxID=51655 RepID=UPI0020331661|nr:uncharacterized protein LOC105398770 isoform X1 [Plutella xylostella]
MKFAHFSAGCLILLAVLVDIVQPTCVLESDFGFKINCAFKKSGLFRVRNLGGVKAHASIGFSLGDELGFEQSLTNLDPSRRRSVSLKNGAPPNLLADGTARANTKQEKRGKQNRIMMRPPAPSNRVNQAAIDKLSSLHRRVSSTMQPIVVSGPSVEVPTTMNKVNPAPKVTIAKPMPMGVPPFKPLPPKDDHLNVVPITTPSKKTYSPLQIPQSKGPGLAYQSENYPKVSHEQVSKMISQISGSQQQLQQFVRITPAPLMGDHRPNAIFRIPTTVNPFVPMPVAAPPTQAAISIIPGPVFKDSVQIPIAPNMLSNSPTAFLTQNTFSIRKVPDPISNFVDPVPHQVHELANQLHPVYNTKKVDDYNSITGYGDDTSLKFTKEDINEKIAEIARAGNISMEAVEAAIALRQQQLLNKYASLAVPPTTSTTTTTTTTTTEVPLVFQPEPEPEIIVQHAHQVQQHKKRIPTSGKVMNAPREYYPVGYEKNFDDAFQSKVDLPETSFHCGDQKYFPGLYGDENLGCMVFHVCALTDDGLVMKSFLCPESTLFDQTILKCNWWFYVDCKNTRRLYDTNIPVSKSYQLMKALTFFSNYKKDMDDANRSANPEDMEGVKEAISILENQNNNQRPQNNADSIQIITPQPLTNTESAVYVTPASDPSPVYRVNRNYKNNTTRSSNSNTQSTRNTNSQSSEVNKSKEDLESANSDIKLITLNTGLSFKDKSSEDAHKNTSSVSFSKNTSAESKERQNRRRQTSRNNRSSSTTSKPYISRTVTTTVSPSTVVQPTTPAIEVIKQEIQPIEYFQVHESMENSQVKQERLTDQIPTVLKEAENSPPVRRFYRSSAEASSKEMTVVNNEKIQIVRPTSTARLVGEFATPTAAIAKLDEAILGRRYKKDTGRIAIVTPELSPTFRERT